MATVSVEAHWRVYSPRSSYLAWYLKTHIVTGVRITAATRTYRLVICPKSAEHSRADKTDANFQQLGFAFSSQRVTRHLSCTEMRIANLGYQHQTRMPGGSVHR